MSAWFCTNKQDQNYDNALPMVWCRLQETLLYPLQGMTWGREE